jgi:Flp pilus assembly protein CpaB
MTELKVPTNTGNGWQPGSGPRAVRPRRALPGGRAVLGAFLVAAAVVGVFGAYLSATAAPDAAYAVAAEDIEPGQVISGADVRFVPIDLPPDVRARSITDPEALSGATVLHARRPGELIQGSDVIRSGGPPGTREMSFAVDASRALGERIVPGERVDVLATYGSGDQAYTAIVVADALVLRAGAGGGGLAGQGRLELTLALAEAEAALALAHAVDVGQVTVVRATNSGARPSTQAYRPADGPGAVPHRDPGGSSDG